VSTKVGYNPKVAITLHRVGTRRVQLERNPGAGSSDIKPKRKQSFTLAGIYMTSPIVRYTVSHTSEGTSRIEWFRMQIRRNLRVAYPRPVIGPPVLSKKLKHRHLLSPKTPLYLVVLVGFEFVLWNAIVRHYSC
jgi:hypothetical protein